MVNCNNMKGILALLYLCSVCSGSRILVFYPGVSGSLLLSFNPLFQELSRRGHELTVVTKIPLRDADKHNITQVVIKRENNVEVFEVFKKLSFIPRIIYGWKGVISDCEKLFEIPEIKELMNAHDKYDLFIGSPYYFLECSIALAHHLRLPVLNIYSNRFSIHASHPGGHPNPLAYISELHLPFGDNMNLWKRTVNVVFNTAYAVGLSVYYLPPMARVVQRYFPDAPPLQDMLSRMPVSLVNTNIAIHHPQPTLPGVIPVGGLTISGNQSLPQDLQAWMDESDEGVILFSLGSNLKVSSLEYVKLKEILETFARLPQRVLMKWEGEKLPGKPDNVRSQKWIPQAAVLAHKHCRLFMTHGGLHSWEEAVYFGVPLLGLLPVFFDQEHNLDEMQGRGQGLYFSGPWSPGHLHAAIQEVLLNPKYKENLQKASKVLKDQPMRPLDTAVFWTEYVIRHRGATHLQSSYSTIPWYQLICLDVISVIIVFLSLVLWIVCTVLRALRQCIVDYEYTIFNKILRLCYKVKKTNK
ncbi:UDP-glycosyltransferase UGT4-like [Macrosteles quadrilineatus]|uniref:UDP-glycosyltransferase UGT4-like n=1 Tax=Macrosteles quadrilineatus TaxID=74068 RepID=UPI0023E23692|nr:UDP-glycosyltransferase UGT4-like [Macrosteles quadrilineatus]